MKTILLLILLLVTSTRECVGEAWEVVGSTQFPQQTQPLIFEGLCTDGKNFIMNTKYNVFFMDTNLNILQSTLNAIPDYLMEEGYNHLGDCVCDERRKLCYYAVEEPEKVKPSIFVYNLTSTGVTFFKERHERVQSHMPWVALDYSTGYLYSSEYDDVNQLRVYSADSLEYLHTLQISGDDVPLSGVQGGAFYEGKLYLGINKGDSVYEVDVSTGKTDLALQQYEEGSKGEYEFEGLTFLDLRNEGKGIMHNTGNHIFPAAMIHSDKSHL